MKPRVLSIAGSDPSGGAGIQADLKTIAALGGYGMAALTSLTAQNTRGVRAVHPLPPSFVAEQVDAVFDDVDVDAVKIGMLHDAAVAAVVADLLARHRPPAVVLDPVMVATSGDPLLEPDAVAVVRERLLPLVGLVTPNTYEAALLLGTAPATDLAGLRAQAAALVGLGAPRVLLKGGHLGGEESPDVLALAGGEDVVLAAPRVDTDATHGTGCTLSSAVAVLRPQRPDWLTAARDAKAYLGRALRAGADLRVGHGHGPLDHAV